MSDIPDGSSLNKTCIWNAYPYQPYCWRGNTICNVDVFLSLITLSAQYQEESAFFLEMVAWNVNYDELYLLLERELLWSSP